MSIPNLSNLSRDLIGTLAGYLGGPDIARLSQACKNVFWLSYDDDIWRECCKNHFGDALHRNHRKVINAGRWKEFYISYHRQQHPLTVFFSIWKSHYLYSKPEFKPRMKQVMCFLGDERAYYINASKQLVVPTIRENVVEGVVENDSSTYASITTDSRLIYALTKTGYIHVIDPKCRIIVDQFFSGVSSSASNIRDNRQDEISLVGGRLQIHDNYAKQFIWLSSENKPQKSPIEGPDANPKYCARKGDLCFFVYPAGSMHISTLNLKKTMPDSDSKAMNPASSRLTILSTPPPLYPYLFAISPKRITWSSIHSTRDKLVLCHALSESRSAIHTLSFKDIVHPSLWGTQSVSQFLKKVGEAPFKLEQNTVLWKETILLTYSNDILANMTKLHLFDITTAKHVTINTSAYDDDALEEKMITLIKSGAKQLQSSTSNTSSKCRII